VDVRFLGQPFPETEQLGTVIGDALQLGDREAAWVVTAWGKRSGLSRLADVLKQFRHRGGRAEAIVGVDEGGATKEGLELALELFDRAYVFHDPGARTFHPKLYVVEGPSTATVAVGSGNTTKGGLYTNYEASAVLELDLNEEADRNFLAEARAYHDRLTALTDFCKPLSSQLIEELLNDPNVVVVSESRANRERGRRRARQGSGVFGSTPITGLREAPPPATEPVPGEDEDDDAVVTPPDEPEASELPEVPETIEAETFGIRGFFKALSKNDTSLRGSPGQIIVPIGFKAFFGDLNLVKDETATGGPREEDRWFPATFRDGGFEKRVENARVVFYVPAQAHRRKNNEVRFTFRDREILNRLSEDDVLVFGRENGEVVVTRQEPDWRPSGVPERTRYGVT
jgi:hypothetical protein